MSEMNELSELYEESNDLQMDVMPSESHLPHIKRGPSPGEQPGQIAGPEFESEGEGEEFDDWEDDYDSGRGAPQRLIHELTAPRRAEPERQEKKQGSHTKRRFGVSGPAHHHVESALI
ncbi:hypothetical protein ABFV05_007572 [Capra hircus]